VHVHAELLGQSFLGGRQRLANDLENMAPCMAWPRWHGATRIARRPSHSGRLGLDAPPTQREYRRLGGMVVESEFGRYFDLSM
jgi:hypothetical protein